MSAILRNPEVRLSPEQLFSVNLRVSNRAIVSLQLLAIEIRSQSGAVMSRSAILRALVRWMEACDIDTRTIHSRDDLRASLFLVLLEDEKHD